MSQDKNIKKMSTRRWWKVIVGTILVIIGLFFGALYAQNNASYVMAVLCVVALGPAIFFLYTGLKSQESGYVFKQGNRKFTGDENALIWCAKRKGEKDIPTNLLFVELPLNKIPTGARPKYLRNISKHVYELIYDTVKRGIKPVMLPDKKNFSPELFKIPATMQPVKDYFDYSPPTMLQKIAPWILLLAMVIVGFLIIMSGPSAGGEL